MPPAPSYNGNIEKDPARMRRYERKVEIRKRITKRMIPPAEQALRLLEKLEDEAADALAETPISHYDDEDGMQRRLQDIRTEGLKL